MNFIFKLIGLRIVSVYFTFPQKNNPTYDLGGQLTSPFREKSLFLNFNYNKVIVSLACLVGTNVVQIHIN